MLLKNENGNIFLYLQVYKLPTVFFFFFWINKLPTVGIYATYFGGDKKVSLASGNEAREIWLKFLPSERVLPF